ncbi:3'-5' exoribonuclease [Chromobacterium sp. S0633]|uniref:3'-5' exonuclease n=1 Tax=Chromobacterium sp. S0633 TaxID=2957805 RepID=UPI00209E6535|nr:3'-5' exonuclease [Chromobacterium sp. S0633]MCP1289851.1 3'-5' exoribonuclease [Chromobacterium sp. S0633]
MKTRQIVIDNETMDTTPSAVLLTIGAVAVEVENGRATVLARWYRRIHAYQPSIDQPGRTYSDSTLSWWLRPEMDGSPAYKEAMLHTLPRNQSDRIPLWLAMHSLHAWLQLNPHPIWGNGSDFDNTQLQHAFNQHGLRWPYWRNRCLRSVRGLVRDLHPNTALPEFPADKIKHHALHDAEHEADVLAALLHAIEERAA